MRANKALILALAVVALSPLGAVRAEHGGDNGRSISGATAFPTCNPLAIPAGRYNMEAWPHLAVNPTNPNNIAVVWVQDWADGIVVGVSHDGGDTWTKSIPPESSACSGATAFNSAFDQHLSFGPDGRLYLSNFNVDSLTGLDRVTVHVSDDGGASWTRPATLEEPSVLSGDRVDWSWVVADPTRPGAAYAAWMKLDDALTRIDMRFARSSDGGGTWSAPVDISPAPERYFRFPPTIAALPDGSLVNVFYQMPACDVPCPRQTVQVLASRSTDQGDTWSAPVQVALRDNFILGRDDDPRVTKLGVPPLEFPAVSNDGTIYYAWPSIEPDHSSTLYLTSSSDGGVTWAPPTTVRTSSVPMASTDIAVAPDDTLGILFYDFRNDVPGDDPATTDVWFITASSPQGPWRERHVAGPFDILAVPDHIGLYQGIAGTAGGFVSAYTVGTSPSSLGITLTEGPTDIFFRRISSDPSVESQTEA